MEECGEYGLVAYVHMPEVNSEDKDVYVKMDTVESATQALDTLNGRTFDGRSLEAKFVSERTFEKLPKTTTSCVPEAELRNSSQFLP